MARYWEIKGYDSTTEIYSRRIKLGCVPVVEPLLKTLAAKAGLDFDEIVGAYAKKGTKSFNGFLDVSKDPIRPIYSCGQNPHFVAKVVDEET